MGHIDGVIGAGTARYVERVIRDAERSGAPAVVLTVNAGAGYERATRQTVDRIEQAGRQRLRSSIWLAGRRMRASKSR